jgi:hypothetical protein
MVKILLELGLWEIVNDPSAIEHKIDRISGIATVRNEGLDTRDTVLAIPRFHGYD